MKKISLVLGLFFIAISCKSGASAGATASTEVQQPTPEVIDGNLVGQMSKSDLTQASYSEWFDPGAASYRVNDELVKPLKKGLKGVDITIFMGTWCGDSKRETPRLYAILDALDYDLSNVNLIGVTRSKTTPDNLEEGLNIKRVPTIICYKNGEELGRIVEYPVESLEEDMLKILNGEEYKHAYADAF
ncbi:MAG: thioredoxin family protein [Leeuwenhoekiella sp.]